MNTHDYELAHDYECTNPTVECLTSGCSPFCDYQKQATQECVAEGEHFKSIQSVGGYDVCYNCGGTS